MKDLFTFETFVIRLLRRTKLKEHIQNMIFKRLYYQSYLLFIRGKHFQTKNTFKTILDEPKMI